VDVYKIKENRFERVEGTRLEKSYIGKKLTNDEHFIIAL